MLNLYINLLLILDNIRAIKLPSQTNENDQFKGVVAVKVDLKTSVDKSN
jgi:hypothetical protein